MPPNDFLEEIRTAPGDSEPVLTRVKRTAEKYATGRGELVDDALGDTVWGAIRWPRFLGWPDTLRMADGFSVRFQYLEVKDGGVGPGGTINKSKWKDGAPPILWDGPHDKENFRVSFLHHGDRKWKHLALVNLGLEVEWEGVRPWWLAPARRIRYPAGTIDGDGTFWLPQTGPTFLGEFVVQNAFY